MGNPQGLRKHALGPGQHHQPICERCAVAYPNADASMVCLTQYPTPYRQLCKTPRLVEEEERRIIRRSPHSPSRGASDSILDDTFSAGRGLQRGFLGRIAESRARTGPVPFGSFTRRGVLPGKCAL